MVMLYRDDVANITEENHASSGYQNVFSCHMHMGIWTVKLCSNHILQFLTGGAS